MKDERASHVQEDRFDIRQVVIAPLVRRLREDVTMLCYSLLEAGQG